MKYAKKMDRLTTKGLFVLVFASGLLLVVMPGCGPKAMRGGDMTDNPGLDDSALSVKLDRLDIDYLVSTNIRALSNSVLWNGTIEKASKAPLVSIWPIQNSSTQHIDDQMDALLSSIETYMVNSGDVGVVSRQRQQQLINELDLRQSDVYDPQTAGRIGNQLGAQYFITGRITSVEERLKKTRRVQYNLILQVIEVETGLVKFQNEASRSKVMKR
ncbi:MAG: penicillin-binding protein activator LpoB [Verrucomicrobia bacterium]|nr:penicillin-binding protein activator LpoB [Verrucomicrobiota bacterium]